VLFAIQEEEEEEEEGEDNESTNQEETGISSADTSKKKGEATEVKPKALDAKAPKEVSDVDELLGDVRAHLPTLWLWEQTNLDLFRIFCLYYGVLKDQQGKRGKTNGRSSITLMYLILKSLFLRWLSRCTFPVVTFCF